ncbi:flagellar basal body rod protein FlgB [Cellvibrio sp. KY-GH-1]|uniref:flagellar basal body rod protein FlgB n=1 Tax=Cellvibrio sp. KY-GH-1 TaxID=2303332 RepID=UPI0012479179|nr:flagellar basal body rod protein FlgB [Cellvibrio sp. KY-GH-1]QEY18981.1 flagellar basal body rod protein FlgB [Cellvibrio sp. KY-GH-1]
MSIDIDKALGVHAQALDLRVQRSEILAANLANEDTPGFQARDLDFARELQRADSPFDIGDISASADGKAVPQLMYRTPMQASLDGNTVDLSMEQSNFSKNSMDFQTSLTFLNMKFQGLKQAIEGR